MIKYLFILLLLPSIAWGACGGSSPNLTAADATRTEVAACVTASTYGDTITVPVGTETWSSNVTLEKCVTLQGDGIDSTTIEINTGINIIHIAPDATSISTDCAFRVTGFTFDGNFATGSTGVTFGQTHTRGSITKNIRIHNNKFVELVDKGVYRIDQGFAYALIDNNIFYNVARPLVSYGAFTYSWQMETTPQNSLGTDNSVFFEDNTITLDSNMVPPFASVSSGHGGRWVGRFNTYNLNSLIFFQGFDVHGNNGSDPAGTCLEDCSVDQGIGEGTCCDDSNRGVMVAEAYNNTWNLENANRHLSAMDIRGGTVMYFNEQYVDATGTRVGRIQIREEDGADDYLTACEDLPAPGVGPEGWEDCYDPVIDTYIFNNRNTYDDSEVVPFEYLGADGDPGTSDDEDEYVEPDYNYWKYASSFDGTTGIGMGVLASIPATCTTNVGYWATDQGDWNTTGADGVLYKCTSTDTWTAYYEPYTYPHPLQGLGAEEGVFGINISGVTIQ